MVVPTTSAENKSEALPALNAVSQTLNEGSIMCTKGKQDYD